MESEDGHLQNFRDSERGLRDNSPSPSDHNEFFFSSARLKQLKGATFLRVQ